ncbi:MAG: exosome complex protein Rrp42 [Candidatus Nezhaarchaeota archaeon]|nr:exosome complex protein Rrp42 [Candidatus Nezhaarchaeota archaeon]
MSKVKRTQLLNLLSSGKRLDGRGLEDYRSIKVEVGVIGRADGSARVSIGDTVVLAGVKYEVGSPFPDAPNLGVLAVNAEFLPLASPTFETGPPDENAIELARIVDRGLRRAGSIDLCKLCLVPGKSVWIAWVDMYVLNHDGNLIDASSLAASLALLTSKTPVAEVSGGEVKVDLKAKVSPPLAELPVTVTVTKVGEWLIVDPTLDEEEASDARLSISVVSNKICAIQKGGEGSFEVEEVHRAIKIALSKAEELKRHFTKWVG